MPRACSGIVGAAPNASSVLVQNGAQAVTASAGGVQPQAGAVPGAGALITVPDTGDNAHPQ